MGLISRVSSRTYRNPKKPTKNKIMVPKWSDFAKTATHKQMPPADDDWFYIRTAAIARQLYIKGTVGVGRMSVIYGSSANRGFRPSHTHKGNGHIARLAFQELEKMKLVEKAEKGRKLSKDGQRDMDRVAASLVKSN